MNDRRDPREIDWMAASSNEEFAMLLSNKTELTIFNEIDPRREALCGWLLQHGIDPNVIPIPAVIRRDLERCRIYYPACPAWIVDPYATPNEGERFPKETTFVQLESPPLPFPADPRQEMPDDDL